MTDFITENAEEIIKSHDRTKPLYLHLAHLAAHASEGAQPMEVRNIEKVNCELGYIPDENRRRYAGNKSSSIMHLMILREYSVNIFFFSCRNDQKY